MKTKTVLFAALLMSAGVSAQVVVYPNPASETVTVAVSDSSSAVVTIYDMTGQSVRSAKIVGGVQAKLEVYGLPTGRYLVAWAKPEGTTLKVERLEIQH